MHNQDSAIGSEDSSTENEKNTHRLRPLKRWGVLAHYLLQLVALEFTFRERRGWCFHKILEPVTFSL